MKTWAESKQETGQFTGSTGVKVLSAAELSSGYQAWARKVSSHYAHCSPVLPSIYSLKVLCVYLSNWLATGTGNVYFVGVCSLLFKI